MQVRDRECMTCKNKWTSPVRLSKNATGISGEATEFCIFCGEKAVVSSPVREASAETTALVDILGWLDEAREHICDLWSAIEPAMSKKMWEHYEEVLTKITDSQRAAEDCLGGYDLAQSLMYEREAENE